MEKAFSPSFLRAVGLLLALTHSAAGFTATDVENLTPVSPVPVAVDLTSVVVNGSTVFAVGGQGKAAVSYNSGISWQEATSLPASSFNSFTGLATDGTLYVALRFGRTLTSTDLENWTVSSGTAGSFDIVYGEQLFISTGTGNVSVDPIRVSTDGDIWSNPTGLPASTPTMRSIAYGNGVFVAGGDDGVLLHSPDGQTWSTTFDGVPERSGNANRFTHISFANNLFFATGSSALLYTSPDGLTWTKQNPDTTSTFEEVAYINGTYIFGNTFSSTFTTTDLVSFDDVSFGVSGTLNDFAYTENSVIVVGRDGFIGTTTDGTTWTERRQRLGDNFDSLAIGAGLFVTIDSGLNAYYTSDDGVLWTLRYIGEENLRTGVIYGGDRFLALGNSQAVISLDGLSWSEEPNGLNFLPDSIHYENDRFIVLGRGGELAESTDGLNWTRHETGSSEWLWDVTYGEGLYVVTQNTNVLLTSSDLVNWTTVAPTDNSADPYLFVAYGDGRFIATSRAAPFASSDDGISWTAEATELSYFVSQFGYDDEYGFYIHGTETLSRQLLDSQDLNSWTSWVFPANSGLNGIAELNGIVVGVGDNGLILSTAANADGFNGWVQVNFPGENRGDIIGADADPDKDKQSNLEEYARGTDPNTPTTPLETVLTRGAFGTELVWTHPAFPSDVMIDAEYSVDLQTWDDAGLLVIPTDNGDGTIHYRARVTGDIGVNSLVYVRIRWSQVD